MTEMNLYISGELNTRFALCYDFRRCPCGIGNDTCPCRSDTIELTAPLTFDFDFRAYHYSIALFPGLPIDGASVPRGMWASIGHPFDSGLLLFAVLHDYLYAAELLPRSTADAIFVNMLRHTRGRWCRFKIALALKLAGGLVWAGHTPEGVAYARECVDCEITPCFR